MDCGYWFKWPPGKYPYFIKPHGEVVRFYVHNNVPYLNEDNPVDALPADEEEGAIEVLDLLSGDLGPGNVGGPEEPDVPEEAQDPGQKDLKAVALSRDHLLTHIPKNAWCRACQRAKMLAKRARRKANKADRIAEIRAFGDLVTADHL
eukprot:8516566-Heterocapsa_arctica.AAC.1